MGTGNSSLKRKNKSFSDLIKFKRNNKNKRNKTLETLSIEKIPNYPDNFQREEDVIDSKPQSKTEKILFPNHNPLEDNPNISEKENIQKLKSLSTQKLVKIENSNNLEEALDDSFETNCCSNKNKEEDNKKLNDIIYDDVNDNNSFEEDDEESNEENENDENESFETNEEKTKKILMITNNIKTVFINSKSFSNENKDNNNNNNINESQSTLSITTYDYELNFYRNENDIRHSYFSKLVSTQIWTPNMKPKQNNSLIIFDWDDTLLPTSFLTPSGIYDENMKISFIESEKISKLEEAILKLLTEAVEKGNVYIITNAGNGWVEYSANRFYPRIMPILEKIKIISARGLYEKIHPGNSRQWKIEAFLNLKKYINMKLVTNIICIGDSLFEMEAGRILASKFDKAYIKTIKFRETPNLDELLKQLKLVYIQFGTIYSSIKNLTIRVERKKTEKKTN